MGTNRLISWQRLVFLFLFLSWFVLGKAWIEGREISESGKQLVKLIRSAEWQSDPDIQIQIENILTEIGAEGELILQEFLDKKRLDARDYSLALYAAGLLCRLNHQQSAAFLKERLREGYTLLFPVSILKDRRENELWQTFERNYYQHLLTMVISAGLVRAGEDFYLGKIKEMLCHPEPEWAAAALVALGQTGKKESVQTLIEFLSEKEVKENQVLMEACLRGLGESGRWEAVSVLTNLVQNPTWSFRNRDLACGALGRIGVAIATPFIMEFIKKSPVTEEAESALYRLGLAATGYLIAALPVSSPPETRKWAGILGKIRSPESLSALMAAWENMPVTEAETLSQITESMVAVAPEETRLFLEKKLSGGETACVLKAAKVIGCTKLISLRPALIETLAVCSENKTRQVLAGVLAALADSGDIIHLKDLLADEDETVRTVAFSALANLKEGRQFLAQYLLDYSVPGWEKGMRIMGIAGSEEGRALFVHFLKQDREKQKIVAALAAGDSGDWEMVEGLLAVLSEESLAVRKTALYALEQIFLANVAFLRERSDQFLTRLLAVSQDPDPEIRSRTATLLGMARQPVALKRILEMVDDQSGEVRKSVAEALAGYTGDRVRQALTRLAGDRDSQVSHQAEQSLRLFLRAD
ncbi:MAG: HEAT repeat domain-containing protein [Candidatus Omnitrophica bacterium]|nr:HEAT repeat domain-containing protein [Candidatus Omnitrophota bacterium]